MADQNEKRTPQRNIVHCLKCFKPQENLPVHLARVCMKQSDPEERAAAVKEAKKSFKDWAKAGRMWDYKELSEVIPDKASCYRMMRELLQRGCFVANQPHEHDMAASAGESTSAGTSAGTSVGTRYKVDRSTSQEVRRAAETHVAKNFTPAQKEKVARYMAHTTQVAKAHYQMMLLEQIAETAELMMVLNDLSPDDSNGRGNLPEKVLPKRQFSTFLENFPVTLDGSAPPAKKRKEAGFPAEDRSLTDKWHKVQRDHRAEYLLSKFRHRQPTQRQFDRCVEGMKWETNKPKYPTVLKLWTPPRKEDMASNKKLIRSVMTQRWKGLSIKDFGGDKGKGVIANRRFVKGEIVCDYHGNVIQASEGRAMLGAHEDGMCYLFFFKDGERDLCIDAQTFPCSCHKDLDTVGRRINHSSKKPNLKPVHVLLNADGVNLDVILFKALIDIETGTELKFHYGVNRKSHRGEGLDLDWLDE
ncbi:uncharacterized protein LOC115356767 [Myripristis murdjan]|uniref:uncharacterized protein LOC115356767 n=1 Tax=Myripristis murdjan TaxID=586833 RepID=UPI0011764618|nr:uncharacterized protein LOC115356767 [Myripristis murdjan]